VARRANAIKGVSRTSTGTVCTFSDLSQFELFAVLASLKALKKRSRGFQNAPGTTWNVHHDSIIAEGHT
jgi:hypothetical protein